MVSRITLNATGTADVMQVQQVQPQVPGPGEVWLEQTAMGVNPLDVLQRKGGAPLALPSGLGLEGAGRVSAVGEGVGNVRVGDRVAYAMGPVGAYASERLFPAERLVKLPDSLDEEAAAAVLFKGITAQYLLKSTYAVGPGTQVLLYGAGGALGQLMASWARHLGGDRDWCGVAPPERRAGAGGGLPSCAGVRGGHVGQAGARVDSGRGCKRGV